MRALMTVYVASVQFWTMGFLKMTETNHSRAHMTMAVVVTSTSLFEFRAVVCTKGMGVFPYMAMAGVPGPVAAGRLLCLG